MCDARDVYERDGGFWYNDENGDPVGPFVDPASACDAATDYQAAVDDGWADFSTGEYPTCEEDEEPEPSYRDEDDYTGNLPHEPGDDDVTHCED